ncbi:MAG: cobalt-zinc-cadmium efflux system outer membrane protein [Hyphomicrobiaceae bacterium]
MDKRRAELRDAELDVAAARPRIERQLLGFQRGATFSYWDWVATGMRLELSRRLLDIAEQRQGQIRRRVERGALPSIDLIDNERLILERRVRLIDSERAFEQATNTLSLFLRDANGSPDLVQPARLPSDFPEEFAPEFDELDRDIEDAMTQQPLLQALKFELEQAAVKLELAENRVLPGLSLSLGGSRDVGAASKFPDDKGPTVLGATIEFELPVQRREARGEVAEAAAKLRQLKSKLRFAEDRVAADVRNAVIALRAAYKQVDAAKRTRELAETLMLGEERKLDLGESNLINVNIRELQAFDAATQLIATQADYFRALANYHFSLGDSLNA